MPSEVSSVQAGCGSVQDEDGEYVCRSLPRPGCSAPPPGLHSTPCCPQTTSASLQAAQMDCPVPFSAAPAYPTRALRSALGHTRVCPRANQTRRSLYGILSLVALASIVHFRFIHTPSEYRNCPGEWYILLVVHVMREILKHPDDTKMQPKILLY